MGYDNLALIKNSNKCRLCLVFLVVELCLANCSEFLHQVFSSVSRIGFVSLGRGSFKSREGL